MTLALCCNQGYMCVRERVFKSFLNHREHEAHEVFPSPLPELEKACMEEKLIVSNFRLPLVFTSFLRYNMPIPRSGNDIFVDFVFFVVR